MSPIHPFLVEVLELERRHDAERRAYLARAMQERALRPSSRSRDAASRRSSPLAGIRRLLRAVADAGAGRRPRGIAPGRPVPRE